MDIEKYMPKDGKKMWRVEKFTPETCPHCHIKFSREGVDWYRIIYDEKHKVIRTVGYYLCRCIHCCSQFHMVPTESWQVSEEAEANRLCQEEGFVNKIPCIAVGTATVDCHTINRGGLVVEGLPCEPNGYLTDPMFAGARHAVELCEQLRCWDMYAATADAEGLSSVRERMRQSAKDAMAVSDPERQEVIRQALAEWDEPEFYLYLKAKLTGYYAT